MRIQRRRKLLLLFVPAIVIVIIDQWTKFWIRTTPSMHNYEIIDGWLTFHYTQNPGMALGMQWADTPVISIVAIAATLFILVYILTSLSRAKKWYLVCMGLILGGAVGNIIDRLFMARIQNYGTYLEGHVVDFIHFSLQINDYAVFPYIFNVADMAISTSLIVLLIFHNRLLPGPIEDEFNIGDNGEKSGKRKSGETEPGSVEDHDGQEGTVEGGKRADDREKNSSSYRQQRVDQSSV